MKSIHQIVKYTKYLFPKHLYKYSLQEYKPCKNYCLCLIYKNMNNQRDISQYYHCYRTQIKNNSH